MTRDEFADESLAHFHLARRCGFHGTAEAFRKLGEDAATGLTGGGHETPEADPDRTDLERFK